MRVLLDVCTPVQVRHALPKDKEDKGTDLLAVFYRSLESGNARGEVGRLAIEPPCDTLAS